MRKIVVLLLVCTLAALIVMGCTTQESKPYFTRVSVPSGTCGVAPFQTEFLAVISSGSQNTDPTGANLWHDLTWDFGDGGTAKGSLVYHTFADSGVYEVIVRGVDADGDEAVTMVTVTVRIDTMTIHIDSDPASGSAMVAGRDTVALKVSAASCSIDPDDAAAHNNLLYRWVTADSAIYTGREPKHTFRSDLTDTQWIHLTLEDPARSITRRDSVFFVLTPPPSLLLNLEIDMNGESELDRGVFVGGDFNGWAYASNPMVDADDDSLFRLTFTVDRNTTQTFRFARAYFDTVGQIEVFHYEDVPGACSADAADTSRTADIGDELDVSYNSLYENCPE